MIKDRIALIEAQLEIVKVEAADLFFSCAVQGKTELLQEYEKKKKQLTDLEADLRMANLWLEQNAK